MTSKKSKNPPEWSSSKDHDQYMKELKAWTKVTSVPKKDWGWTIALSMPENDQDIRRKIFNLDLESPVGNEEKAIKPSQIISMKTSREMMFRICSTSLELS